jgi:hypothetical protein
MQVLLCAGPCVLDQLVIIKFQYDFNIPFLFTVQFSNLHYQESDQMTEILITSLDVKDIRWPTSLGHHGSDAMVSAEDFPLNNHPTYFTHSTRIPTTVAPTSLYQQRQV